MKNPSKNLTKKAISLVVAKLINGSTTRAARKALESNYASVNHSEVMQAGLQIIEQYNS